MNRRGLRRLRLAVICYQGWALAPRRPGPASGVAPPLAPARCQARRPVTVRTIASLTGQTPRDVDRTISIPRLAGTQGWTVFQIPSTPGRHLVHRPALAVAATLPPLRAVPRRSAGDRRAARRRHRRPRGGGEEEAAGARYAVARNGVARIGARLQQADGRRSHRDAVLPDGGVPVHGPLTTSATGRPARRRSASSCWRRQQAAQGEGRAIAMWQADTTGWDDGFFCISPLRAAQLRAVAAGSRSVVWRVTGWSSA